MTANFHLILVIKEVVDDNCDECYWSTKLTRPSSH